MSALPKPMDAADVAREHESEHEPSSAEQYYAHRAEQMADTAAGNLALLGANLRQAVAVTPTTATVPFFQLVDQVRNSDRCPRCHKTRVLISLSTARVGVREERPDPRIHCACPGGPAFAGAGSVPRSKFAIGTRVRAFQRIPNAWGRGAPIDWITVGTPGTITHLEGHIAAIAFDGHVQPYQHNADALGDIVAVVEGGSL